MGNTEPKFKWAVVILPDATNQALLNMGVNPWANVRGVESNTQMMRATQALLRDIKKTLAGGWGYQTVFNNYNGAADYHKPWQEAGFLVIIERQDPEYTQGTVLWPDPQQPSTPSSSTTKCSPSPEQKKKNPFDSCSLTMNAV